MQMQDAKETIAATSHPPVWSRALFLAWIDTRHGAEPETSAPEEASEGADYVANTRRALEARAGIGAGQ
jgi:hypothetical protein